MFSIIVPIFNTEKYLKDCIDSILNQTCSDFELILIDDGSTDGCPAICDFYAKSDCRVTVIHKANGGHSSARKAGILRAQRPYICYVDSDDRVASTWLEVMRKYIEAANSPDILVFNVVYQYLDKQEELPCRIQSGYYNKERMEKEIYPYMINDRTLPFLGHRLFAVPWNKIYKSKLLKEHYCKDDRIRLLDDAAFVFECFYYANSAYFCEEVLYYYTFYDENSTTLRYYEDYLERATLVCDYMQKHLGDKNPSLDQQLNAYKANLIMRAVVSEVSHWSQKEQALSHIREHIAGSRLLKECRLSDLPHLKPKFFLLSLKLGCFRLCYFLTKANAFLSTR